MRDRHLFLQIRNPYIIALCVCLVLMFTNKQNGLYISGLTLPYIVTILFSFFYILFHPNCRQIYEANVYTIIYTIITALAYIYTNRSFFDEGVFYSCIILGMISSLLLGIKVEKDNIEFVKKAYVIATLIISILVIVRPHDYLGLGRQTLRWSNNDPVDPNFMSAFIVIGTIIAWDYAQKGSFKILNWTIVVLNTITIIRSGSRGGFISLAIGIIILNISWIVERFRQKPVTFLAVIIGTVIAVIVGIKLLPEEVVNRFLIVDNYYDGSNMSRLANWNAAINAIQKNPIIGQGTIRIVDYNRWYVGFARDAHNTFLSVAEMFGLVGLVPFVLFTFRPLVYSIKNRNVLVSSIVIAQVVSYFLINGQLAIGFWVPMVIAWWILRSDTIDE